MDRSGLKRGSEDGAQVGPGWIWGAHSALAALANPARRVHRVIATRNAAVRLPEGAIFDMLSPDAIDRLLPPGAVHQGVAVLADALEPLDLAEACLPAGTAPVLVLDQVTDPQNVGAAFRAAAAFGARAVILQDRKSPPLTGALAKAAVGAIERVAHVRVVNVARTIAALAEGGYLTVGLLGEVETPLAKALADPRPVALALGAEGKGLRQLVAETCERRARIPIAPEVESLNVAAAAAIALYEASRRRFGP